MVTSAVPDLDAMERLALAGTPGEWGVRSQTGDRLVRAVATDHLICVPEEKADAALIVAAVNSLPALIARVRLLEAAAQRYLDYTGEHHWRCEHRTAAVGWKEGEPPVIQCVCGHDALRAALDAQPPNPDRRPMYTAIAGLIEDADRDRALVAEWDATLPREPQG
jgi:hypothetical protein